MQGVEHCARYCRLQAHPSVFTYPSTEYDRQQTEQLKTFFVVPHGDSPIIITSTSSAYNGTSRAQDSRIIAIVSTKGKYFGLILNISSHLFVTCKIHKVGSTCLVFCAFVYKRVILVRVVGDRLAHAHGYPVGS